MAVKSKKTRALVLDRDHFRCRFCGATAEQTNLHVDHIFPESKGGTDSLSNLATLCSDCNLGKSNLYFGNYMKLIGEAKISSPLFRSPLKPPKDYQVNALRQLIEYLIKSGIKEISLEDFSKVIQTPGLRDGINFLFEPISFAVVIEGVKDLTSFGEIMSSDGYTLKIK